MPIRQWPADIQFPDTSSGGRYIIPQRKIVFDTPGDHVIPQSLATFVVKAGDSFRHFIVFAKVLACAGGGGGASGVSGGGGGGEIYDFEGGAVFEIPAEGLTISIGEGGYPSGGVGEDTVLPWATLKGGTPAAGQTGGTGGEAGVTGGSPGTSGTESDPDQYGGVKIGGAGGGNASHKGGDSPYAVGGNGSTWGGGGGASIGRGGNGQGGDPSGNGEKGGGGGGAYAAGGGWGGDGYFYAEFF
jgi:hypothetical protein